MPVVASNRSHPRVALLAFLVILSASTLRAAEPAGAPAKERPDLSTRVGAWLSARLKQSWPNHPEWLAMLADILQGSQLGPEDGWFPKAVAQTRFGWTATRSRLDRDGDGQIGRSEFPGSDADFARLDRDRDGVLTSDDFDWSAHALTPSPGMMLYYRADRDGDGQVTRAELDAWFAAADPDGFGFLSLDDLKAQFAPPRRRTGSPIDPGPSKATLIRGLFRQEIGSLQPGPALDQPAPDFTLRTIDGDREVTLSKEIGPKPIVLVFGNFTCGPFRNQAGNVEKVYRRYKDRAEFLMVYIREAHPIDGWHMASNDRYGVTLPQPKTFGERVEVAQTCRKTLGVGMPLLVDPLDDRVGAVYSGMPSRLYLIDRQGKIAYKSGRGPFGFKPGELEQALILLLQEDRSRSEDRDSPQKQR
jgi:hypothetical protein